MPENMLGRRCCTHTHTSTLGKQVETERGSAGRAVGAWVRGCVADTTEDVRRHKEGFFCKSSGSSGVDTVPEDSPGEKKKK
jgi:hypothetical protein